MSEYQRYEFMTIDRPLTSEQLEAVDGLSSHIEASSTHALIEYNWGDFKHDPIKVLRDYFDGFLYWANWGSPQLAFRFPHGILPADLLKDCDFDDFVTFTRYKDYDILDIQFGEMEPPNEWIDYNLGSMIAIRDELMEGDLRALYIAWLASQAMMYGYDEADEEDYEISTPAVPPGLGTLTAAQQTLSELLEVPEELLAAAAQHSRATAAGTHDDVAAWLKLLTPERQYDYLLRLAHNEPGLSRLLVRELRELGRDKTPVEPIHAEHVTYASLLTESKAIKFEIERKRRAEEQAARELQLKNIYEHRDDYWRQVELATARASGAAYEEAVKLLSELREAANYFKNTNEFQARFNSWARLLLNRPALVRRLQSQNFTLPPK